MNTRPVSKTGRIVAAALVASAVFALPVLAGLASRGLAASQAPAGGLAPAQDTGQSPGIIIDSISPSGFARPGATVKVSGQFRSGTSTLPQGLDVQLRSSGSPLTARSQLDGFAAGSYHPDSVPIATVALPASASPGQTVIWHASFNVDQVGMHAAFVNVYPLTAGVYDPAGTQIAVERTFLPFWSGTDRVGQPVRVAWVWPLIDKPHRGMCPAMIDNGLAASLDKGQARRPAQRRPRLRQQRQADLGGRPGIARRRKRDDTQLSGARRPGASTRGERARQWCRA